MYGADQFRPGIGSDRSTPGKVPAFAGCAPLPHFAKASDATSRRMNQNLNNPIAKVRLRLRSHRTSIISALQRQLGTVLYLLFFGLSCCALKRLFGGEVVLGDQQDSACGRAQVLARRKSLERPVR